MKQTKTPGTTNNKSRRSAPTLEGLFDNKGRAAFSPLHDRLIKNFGRKMRDFNNPRVHEHHSHSRGH